MKKAVIAFSFALRKMEPNPCNMKLAREVERIVKQEREKGESVYVVVQWEISLALKALHSDVIPDFVVWESRIKGDYLDSDEVVEQSIPKLKGLHINEAIPVAHPFLHLFKCKKLIREAGFTVCKKRIGSIGFDGDSLQWWTRGPIRLVLYTIKQVLFGHRGHYIEREGRS